MGHAGPVLRLPCDVQGGPRTDAKPKTVRPYDSDDRVQPHHGGTLATSLLGGISRLYKRARARHALWKHNTLHVHMIVHTYAIRASLVPFHSEAVSVYASVELHLHL